MSTLLAWFRDLFRRNRRSSGLDHLRVVMYTRHGCHLCDDAWLLLRRSRDEHGFQLTAVDVDQDAELQREHGLRVPVVSVNGKERFWGRVSPILWRRLLEGERNSSRSWLDKGGPS